MDYKLPGANGVSITATIRKEFPDARVLLLSIYEGDEDVWRATQAGAVGYVAKSAEIEEIITAIRVVAEGKSYFSSGLAEKVAKCRMEDRLSPGEFAVLREVVFGRCNKEIMTSLQLTKTTVKRRLENIFTKLHVLDRTQAANVAIQRGIIHLDEV